jgi:hypothetical protein
MINVYVSFMPLTIGPRGRARGPKIGANQSRQARAVLLFCS